MRLFPNNVQIAKDGDDYNRIYAGYRDHYAPIGFLENLYVERIAAESLRLSRLFGHEQKVLGWGAPFEARSMGMIVRYESTITRHLDKAI